MALVKSGRISMKRLLTVLLRLHAAVDTRLQLAGLIDIRGVEGHAEGENLVDDAQGEVATDHDAHLLAEIALGEGQQGGDHLLGQQDDADGDQDLGSSAPEEAALLQQFVDGIHGAVKDHSVHLRHQGADEGEDQRGGHQPFVGFDKGEDILEQLAQGHLALDTIDILGIVLPFFLFIHTVSCWLLAIGY